VYWRAPDQAVSPGRTDLGISMPRRGTGESGAVVVEFAFVFVILATLILALAEFGAMFMYQSSVSAAAREGARIMAITNDTDKAAAAAQDAFPFGTLDAVLIPSSCPEPQDRNVTVEVTVRVNDVALTGFFGSHTLTGVGAMRCGG
jgi:Flp pilus assembly protein TadG